MNPTSYLHAAELVRRSLSLTRDEKILLVQDMQGTLTATEPSTPVIGQLDALVDDLRTNEIYDLAHAWQEMGMI